MRILITGGAGFIGSHLAEHLVKRGDDVYIIDNFATGRMDNLEGLPIRVYEEDISESYTSLIFKLVKPDVVIHAAASYKNPDDWERDVRTNCMGMVNVLTCSKTVGVKKLIYFQTALTYGIFPTESPVTLNCPLNPRASSYAISKTTAEYYLGLSKLPFISFRLANCGGERNISGPVATFYQRLSQGKNCFVMDTRRDFIYVKDLVAVVVRAIDGEGTRNYYHISSGRDYSILELYTEIRKAMGLPEDTEVEVRPRTEDDAPTILIDPSQTEADFPGWKCATPLSEWVPKHIEWCKTHSFGETYTHLKGMK
jgi:UDP-glucose 4-epimerase